MRTECVPKYLKSTQCVPNVNFADLFGEETLFKSRERALIDFQKWLLKMSADTLSLDSVDIWINVGLSM